MLDFVDCRFLPHIGGDDGISQINPGRPFPELVYPHNDSSRLSIDIRVSRNIFTYNEFQKAVALVCEFTKNFCEIAKIARLLRGHLAYKCGRSAPIESLFENSLIGEGGAILLWLTCKWTLSRFAALGGLLDYHIRQAPTHRKFGLDCAVRIYDIGQVRFFNKLRSL